MKKILIVVVLLLCAGFGFAQESVLEGDIFNINLGFIGGYRLDDNAPVGGQRFSFDFAVAENVRTGVALTTFGDAAVTTEYSTFVLDYRFDRLGLTMDVGNNGAGDIAAGLGFAYNLMEAVTQDVIRTGLRINVQYLFDLGAGVEKGTVSIGFSGSFGV